MSAKLTCPDCGSKKVATAAEDLFMVNSGEHYCHAVKAHDSNARAVCLKCRWDGKRRDLVPAPSKNGGQG